MNINNLSVFTVLMAKIPLYSNKKHSTVR